MTEKKRNKQNNSKKKHEQRGEMIEDFVLPTKKFKKEASN